MIMVERLRKLVDLGVSATAIAKGIGRNKGTVSNWINGNRNINEENEERLKKWLEKFKEDVNDI